MSYFKKNADEIVCFGLAACGVMPAAITPYGPYGETSAKKAANSGQGCCPGQTGHHLLPKEMFSRSTKVPDGKNKNGTTKYKSVPDPDNCPEYTGAKHRNAPTVCVEGVNNTHGSHGAIHDKLEGRMKDHRNNHGDSITMDEAIDKAVESHNEQFKPPCNPQCLKQQLKDYYKDLCKGKMKPRGGTGTDVDDADATTNDNNAV